MSTISKGMTLGGFRIERRLGGGGMGEVFLATQLALDREVALKVLPQAITRDPELVGDFRQEMRNLAKLDHPNVATAFTAGEHQGIHFLAMAYVDGEDLAARVEREGALPEGEALDCVLKVAEALKHAWDRHQLLHRDIKPGNIMIDREGVVKLMDMGLSKTLYEDLGASVAGTIMGTPNYMSPEQARGESGLAVASDIYALGVTLYHLVTGRLPFDKETPEETLEAVLTEGLVPAATLRQDLSKGTERLIERMAARDQALRYPAWDAVIADIRRALSGRSETDTDSAPARPRQVHRSAQEIAAGRERERARQTKARRRSAFRAVLATGVIAAGLGGGAVYLRKAQLQADDARARAREAEKEQRSAEQRAADLEAEAEAKTVEAALTRAMVDPDVDGALAALRELREGLADPVLVQRVTEATWTLETRRREGIQGVLTGLQARADALVASGDYGGAVTAFADYRGLFAEATREEREALARATAEAGARAEEVRRQQGEAWLRDVQESVTADLLNGDSDLAALTIQAFIGRDLTPEVEAQGLDLLEMVQAIQGMPALVLGAYRKYLGRETTVYFNDGKQRVEIVEVSDDRVRAVYHGPRGNVPRDFGIDDLGLRERVVRLGRTRRADLDMIRGLLAYRAGRGESAQRYLQQADHELAERLLAAMEQRAREDEPEPAAERTSS